MTTTASNFMDTYAMQACWHMWKWGTTREQIAMAASKNHTQLRGEAERRQVKGCRCGLTENGGGVISWEGFACCVNIFASVA
jgi:hypothetical protein